MSRILRRPMFRGGPVLSYGTGIASGLADGGRVNYQGGGQIGGGYIYGEPMADGRYGFGMPKPKKHKFNKHLYDNGSLILGAELGHLDSIQTVNEVAEDEAGKINEVESVGELTELDIAKNKQKFEDKKVNTWDEYITIEAPKIGPGSGGRLKDRLVKNPNYKPPTKTVYVGRNQTPTETKLSDSEILEMTKTTKPGEEITTGTTIKNYVPGEGDYLSTKKSEIPISEKAEPLEISVEDQITQQAELFDKLFSKEMEAKNKQRLKKARIQDLSDIGLDIFAKSTKEGANVRTMLGEVAEEMVDKPSRTELLQAKIDDQVDKRYQTSVALAINDYIAGKRSKEQTDQLLAKMGIDQETRKELIDYQISKTSQANKKRSINERINEDRTGRSTIKKVIAHTDEWMKDNNMPGTPRLIDQTKTKVDLVEENKNKVFIDSITKEVFTITNDGQGGFKKKVIYGIIDLTKS